MIRISYAIVLSLSVLGLQLSIAQPPAVPGTPPSLPINPNGGPAVPPPPTGTPPAAPPMAPAGPPKPVEWPKQIGGRPLAEWIADLKSTDPTVRDFALRIIPQFGPDGRKLSAKTLVGLIDDPDPGIRINAILLFAGMGYDNKDDLKAVAEALRAAILKTAPGSMIRLHAARTLANMGPEAYGAMGALLAIAEDPSWETRQAVAAALGRLGVTVYEDKAPPTPPGGKPQPPAVKRHVSKQAMEKLLLVTIKDASANVRLEALQSLLILGPPYAPDPASYITAVKTYLPAILERLKVEKDKAVIPWLYIVQIMYDDRTIDSNTLKVAALALAPESHIRIHALNALAVLGPKAKPALPEIRQALKAEDHAVVVTAIGTILAMGEEGKYAIDDLTKLKAETKDENLKKLIDEAIKVLKEAGEPKKEAPKKEEPKKP